MPAIENPMDDSILQLFIQLITAQIGLQIRQQDRSALSAKLLTRMKFASISDPEKYYQFLTITSFETQNEWRELVLLLTTVESYFMRDKGQFSLLEKVIFPELIEQKKKLSKTLGIQPTLRIWSAGCSTGEEPYSLAIILKQLIFDWEEWKIVILGTDINEKVIEKAHRGVYTPWSFRLVDPQVQKQYFNQQKTEWKINRELRESVKFSCLNLITDHFPNVYKNIYNMDLILCRNVFVYFEPKYISVVLKKFANTLKSGGYLITGHAEIGGQIINEFQPKIFPESVVYQCRDLLPDERLEIDSRRLEEPKSALEESGKSLVDDGYLLARGTIPASFAKGHFSETATLLTESSILGKMLRNRYVAGDLASPNGSFSQIISKPIAESAYLMLIEEAKNSFQNKAYTEAINQAKESICLQPKNFDANYLLAQIYANLGKYSQAIEYCQQASKIDSISVLPDYLQAQVAEEQGELEKAKRILKKIIYFSPSFISAYLELGNIYNKQGEIKRAVTMYNSSCAILTKLPPHTPIEQQGKMTANQLLLDVKQKLLRL
jgi:chemotaxis protein methyltransferase CheR